MGRRKRLCITSIDIPIDSEIHDQSSEFSETDIPTEGDQSDHPQTTEGGQSTAEEHSSTEGGQSGKSMTYIFFQVVHVLFTFVIYDFNL